MSKSESTEFVNSNRAGKYVKQPTGYRAFLPEPLPPHPPVKIDGELQVRLSQADRALGRLESRNRRFMYQSYIHLFHDDEMEAAT